MNAVIILKCEGRKINGFNFCNGVGNQILDLRKIKHTEDYLSLIDYLDKITKIFDRPCCKSSVISNAIYKIYQMGYINEELQKSIAHYYSLHNMCGMVLMCLLTENC